MGTHVLSVVIPVYNRSYELNRALNSLVMQSEKSFQVIVVDDGSTECLQSLVEYYQTKLNLVYRRIDNSGGPARPRNVGIHEATSEWVSFLDSDDWWDSNRISVIKEHLNSGGDVIYHKLRRVSVKQKFLTSLFKSNTVGKCMNINPLDYMFTVGNPIPNSSSVVRKCCLHEIGLIDEDRRIIEDCDTWITLAKRGASFRFIDQVLGSYTVGNGISAPSLDQVNKHEYLYFKHQADIPASKFDTATKLHLYTKGVLALQIGNFSLARELLSKAFSTDAFILKLRISVRYLQSLIFEKMAHFRNKSGGGRNDQ